MLRFFDFLFPPRADEAVLRDVPDDAFFALMAPHAVPETNPETVALFPFTAAPVRAAVHEAKYHGSGRAFRLLSAALADYLRAADAMILVRTRETASQVSLPRAARLANMRGAFR